MQPHRMCAAFERSSNGCLWIAVLAALQFPERLLMPLLRCLTSPVSRLRVIVLDALTQRVEVAQLELRLGVALIGSLAIPRGGLRVTEWHADANVVEVGQLLLRFGKVLRRGQPIPENTRLKNIPGSGPDVPPEYLYNVIDALDEVAKEIDKSIPQVALNWLLQRPTVDNIIIGARNEEQLLQNIEAVGWSLSKEQVAKLDAASEQRPIYPYWHQRQNLTLNPPPKFY